MRRVFCCCIVLPAIVCFPAASALATHPIHFRQFTFAPPHSELNVTGGVAGIDETLKIFGDFDLIIDRFAHPEPPDFSIVLQPQAKFVNVEAKLVGPSFFDGRDLDDVLNLSGLDGFFLDDNTIRFRGEDGQGADLIINSPPHQNLWVSSGSGNSPS